MHPKAIRQILKALLKILALALPLLAPRAGDVLTSVVTDARAEASHPVTWKEYLAARAAFDAEVGAYWTSIAEKRRGRNAKRRQHQPIALDDYVLTQPPVYTGPKRPPGPSPEPPPQAKPRLHLQPRCASR